MGARKTKWGTGFREGIEIRKKKHWGNDHRTREKGRKDVAGPEVADRNEKTQDHQSHQLSEIRKSAYLNY